MIIFVERRGEPFEMVLPWSKVRVVLIRLYMKKYKLNSIEATRKLDQFGQEKAEKLYFKKIKREMDSYIRNEIAEWDRYERDLKKGDKNGNKNKI